ncbi:MAG TPA: DUF4476 domain-containing protein [Ferruginibacter sp.]|nr:DUF4476 domain-containing protein [Ferruginibacter sp.]
MRRLLFSLFILFTGFICNAQQYHFVYLQTDNKQPFYIRINEKLYSSSASGYVVIPKLSEGSHTLSVGFPKNEWPAQNLTINVANKDMGFLLKNFDNKGWGLFNLQSMEVVTTSSETNSQPTTNKDTKKDEFSNILAEVVNTPSIKEERKELPKAPPQQILEEVKKENIAVVVAAEIPEPVNILKISSATDTEGMVIVYVDKQTKATDTIQVYIPIDKNIYDEPLPVKENKEVVQINKKAEENVVVEPKAEEKKNDPKFIEIDLPNPNAKPVEPAKHTNEDALSAAATIENKKTAAGPVMINSDCKQIATQDDFLKIRKKMTAEKNDEDMIRAAVKMFRQKCYSTDQLKNLSVLFLKDEGKYKLFDAAYPYIHDSGEFRQLESQFTDPYIITRFRAMIRN